MSGHSMRAYRIALDMRTARTLMVEGDTDKAVIQRLMIEGADEDLSVALRPRIDTPALISDAALFGLGNKAKVERIASECAPTSMNFRALVDREWENFDIDALKASNIDAEYDDLNAVMVKTYGHSMENYFLDCDMVTSLLKRNFHASVTLGALRIVEENFSKLKAFALAYSLTASKLEIITRTSRLLALSHISIENGQFGLMPAEFIRALEGRGVSEEASSRFEAEFVGFSRRIEEADVTCEVLKWAGHGHLAHEAIWCCVAKILQASGCETAAYEQIERGLHSEKLRHGADRIAAGQHESRPLHWLARWLNRIEA